MPTGRSAARSRPRTTGTWATEAAAGTTRARTTEAATRTAGAGATKATTGTGAAEAASARSTRTTFLARAGLADRERTPIEGHAVEALNRRLGVGAIEVFDERKTPGATCFPVNGEHDL